MGGALINMDQHQLGTVQAEVGHNKLLVGVTDDEIGVFSRSVPYQRPDLLLIISRLPGGAARGRSILKAVVACPVCGLSVVCWVADTGFDAEHSKTPVRMACCCRWR